MYRILRLLHAAPAINELDKNQQGLLLCLQKYDSWVREEGVNPSRSRRCEWGRNPVLPLSTWWMGRRGE